MIDRRIFGRGRVTYDTFEIDPAIPIADQVDHLTEGLLQVEYENDVVLDVGWYPEVSPVGHFRLMVVADCNWETPLYIRSCTNVPQLMEWIRIGVKVAESMAYRHETCQVVLSADHDPAVSAPTWEGVLRTLLRMDGDQWTLTYLEAPDGAALMVGGGNEGLFLVDYLVDRKTQENYVLTDRGRSGPSVELVCGGQAADFLAHWCVDLGMVLDAVQHFCRAGGMAPHLSWEEGR